MFYIVLNTDTDRRHVRHTAREDAVKEAKRLASNFKGQNFMVMACTDHVIDEPNHTVLTRLEEGRDLDPPF